MIFVCLVRGAEDCLNNRDQRVDRYFPLYDRHSPAPRPYSVFPVDVQTDEDIEEMEMEPPPQSKASCSSSSRIPSKVPEEKLLPPAEVADANLSAAEIPEKPFHRMFYRWHVEPLEWLERWND